MRCTARWIAPVYPIRRVTVAHDCYSSISARTRLLVMSHPRTRCPVPSRLPFASMFHQRTPVRIVCGAVPPLARTAITHQEAARTTSGLHFYVPSCGVYRRWLALICPIRRRVPPVLALLCLMRRETALALARAMSHQAARTTSGLHCYVPSCGVNRRWLALLCPIRRRVPPVACIMEINAVTLLVSHCYVPSGGRACPVVCIACSIMRRMNRRWLALLCPIRGPHGSHVATATPYSELRVPSTTCYSSIMRRDCRCSHYCPSGRRVPPVA
ncbi:hypothetical protein AVEN_22586-1 [Araneus ventricosus]|uniref:Uncharacterized protein n=1 Tax=Araneus ventricosus TaxID=182803 RepID=A0A4Y2E690_ARAVE|nr:hypothetical protein AVEN_22586-1 [Araneus ventricosus]